MWIFVRYGFYSVACANKPDGSLDRQTVMIRARCRDHLQNLRDRFSALADAEITAIPNRDYRYRLIIPKQVWVPILAEMAEEQDWSNFKNEAARFQAAASSDYIHALHDVWGVMHRLQEKPERLGDHAPRARRSS
jgi:hypothetical protein